MESKLFVYSFVELNRETMYYSSLNIPANILVNLISAVPVICLSLSGLRIENDVDDDSIDQNYDWTNKSVWVLRVFGSIFISILALLSFQVLRNYALTAVVTDKLNTIVKDRERNSIQRIDKATDDINTVGEGNSDIISSRTETLLHFSFPELYRIYKSMESSSRSKRDGLRLISRLNFAGLTIGILSLASALVALVCDVVYLVGAWSTALISIAVISLFYIVYECFRFSVLQDMEKWSDTVLLDETKAVYQTYVGQGNVFKKKIEAVLKSTPFSSVDSMNQALMEQSNELSNANEANSKLAGFKRLFLALSASCLFSVAITVFAVIG